MFGGVMIKRFKQQVRIFALRLQGITEHWIFSVDDWRIIDQNDPEGRKIIERAQREWPNDPHVAYASSMWNTFNRKEGEAYL